MSYTNLCDASKTLASIIWKGIKDEKQLSKIFTSGEQISIQAPVDAKTKDALISVFLYNVAELTSMRNQPQPHSPNEPRTLLYLNLHYLITPLTQNVETDQLVVGKIMQLFAEMPILRGPDLQGSLKESGDELKVVLESLGAEDLNKVWTMLGASHKLSVSYSVFPVRIQSSVKQETKPVVIKKPALESVERKTLKKA